MKWIKYLSQTRKRTIQYILQREKETNLLRKKSHYLDAELEVNPDITSVSL